MTSCHSQQQLAQHYILQYINIFIAKKEKTMLLSMVKEKLMVDPELPFGLSQVDRGRLGGFFIATLLQQVQTSRVCKMQMLKELPSSKAVTPPKCTVIMC